MPMPAIRPIFHDHDIGRPSTRGVSLSHSRSRRGTRARRRLLSRPRRPAIISGGLAQGKDTPMRPLAAALAALLLAGPAHAQFVAGPTTGPGGVSFGFGHPGKRVIVTGSFGVARPIGVGGWPYGGSVISVTT